MNKAAVRGFNLVCVRWGITEDWVLRTFNYMIDYMREGRQGQVGLAILGIRRTAEGWCVSDCEGAAFTIVHRARQVGAAGAVAAEPLEDWNHDRVVDWVKQ